MEQSEPLTKGASNMPQGEHIILRLTYVSRHNANNKSVEVTRILAQAHRNNQRNGITGALVISEDYFLQSIEGPRPVINELLRKLFKDERHFSLQVIECNEVEQRRWGKWSMKHLSLSDQDREYVRKFSVGTNFDPYLINSAQIIEFIEILSRIEEEKEKHKSETKHRSF
ncbi:BLUF domain-containing protein [Psychrobacter vallis]|uniref:BLUF domain-containing protein n=1 Tax=Psychrobacter vallis TaxID=248451 RepID=UPI0019198203|nr:BLUF domain-containing protein [Psychrobacter vallis]